MNLYWRMARKKTLKDFTKEDLLHDLAYRLAEEHYRPGMTMSEMELCVWEAFGSGQYAGPALQALLSRMPLEKPTAKKCPKCGRRVPVRARDRERTLRTLCGPVTLKRNYHYCDRCQLGFYPVDRVLDLPEQGELSAEMEKRVLDFAINDVYGDCVTRWRVHYRDSISENLLRRVVARVGGQCEAADSFRLQEELKTPPEETAEVLVIENDGSLLPVRGQEPWKEAKVGVIYRHDPEANKPIKGSARYVSVVGCLDEFAPVLQDALEVERLDEAQTVVWLGDGLPCNWRLADQLAPDAIQILDWYHAVKNAMDCGKALLGEDSPDLPLWQRTVETLLARGDAEALIHELMNCIPLVPKGRRNSREALEALNTAVGYFRNNVHRMRYALFREHGFPIGSGAAESAHRHVLQVRMKRTGQHWAMRNARRMARLRAAYRTGGALEVYGAIRRAHRDTIERRVERRDRRNSFRWARYGSRDAERSLKLRSN